MPMADRRQRKGCAEAGHESEETIRVCDRLDAAGNTAKAITRACHRGSGLTVLASSPPTPNGGCRRLNIRDPFVIVGLFLGAMMPPLFPP